MKNTQTTITDENIQQSVAKGKAYCLFLYLSGPNRDHSPEEADRIQAAHLRYLFTLRQQGHLILNGPVTDEDPLKGIGIFNFTDKALAKQLLEGDPAVKAGRLSFRIFAWFGLPGDSLPG